MESDLKGLAGRWTDKDYPLFFSIAASKKTRRKKRDDSIANPYPYHTWDEAVDQAKYLGSRLESWVKEVFKRVVTYREYVNVEEPENFSSRTFEVTQAYDEGTVQPIASAKIFVEGIRVYGDSSSGYCGVLRFDYGFMNGDFESLTTNDDRIKPLLTHIAQKLVLQDRIMSDPVGVALGFALLQERDCLERRKLDNDAWQAVAPSGLAVPKVYYTNRKV